MKPIYLYKQENPDFDRVLELLKTDRLKARVLIKNDPNKYTRRETVVFEKEGSNDFSIAEQLVNMKISINNKIYYTKTDRNVYIYKSGKFWMVLKKAIRPMTINYFQPGVVYDYFLKRFSWMRFLMEERATKDGFGEISFSTIVRKELYSSNDVLKYAYGTNLPIAKLLSGHRMPVREWKRINKYLTNIEAMNPELLISQSKWTSNGILFDTIKMADILNKRINCKWSKNRLKQEHDEWSRLVAGIVIEASNRDLKIADIYTKFEEFSKYGMLKTTRELAIEGMAQKHCVATYVSKVDNGNCAIFHIDGYTAEILKNHLAGGLILNQFKGLKNQEAPMVLREYVIAKIQEFNITLKNDKTWVQQQEMAMMNKLQAESHNLPF